MKYVNVRYICKRRNEKNIDKIDIGTIYENINTGINFVKSQQWNMANYSLLMLGAIIGAFELLWNSVEVINPDQLQLQWIMRIGFTVLAIFATIFIWIYSYDLYEIYEKDLDKYQNIIDNLSNSKNDNYSYTLREKVFSKYPDVKDEFYIRSRIGKSNTKFIIRLHSRVALIGVIFSALYFPLRLFFYLILRDFALGMFVGVTLLAFLGLVLTINID